MVIGHPGNWRRIALFGYWRMQLGPVAGMFLALFVETDVTGLAQFCFAAGDHHSLMPVMHCSYNRRCLSKAGTGP